MEKEFIPYEQALAFKELGFDEPCFAFYLINNRFNLFENCKWEERTNSGFIDLFEVKDSCCVAPTFSQAFRWFREKYDFESWVYKSRDRAYFYSVLKDNRYLNPSYEYSTYEEAELECLKKLIEIVKNK